MTGPIPTEEVDAFLATYPTVTIQCCQNLNGDATMLPAEVIRFVCQGCGLNMLTLVGSDGHQYCCGHWGTSRAEYLTLLGEEFELRRAFK